MPHYALLGGGRLARHLQHYLSLLNLPVSGWARDSKSALNSHAIEDPRKRLRATIEPASHVLLLISDSAIPEVVGRYPFLRTKTLVHCAGAVSFPGIGGAHPLMTFGDSLYGLAQYRRLPFIVESGHRFDELLPGLPNPHFEIALGHKARYHALCVMAGNFTQMLWQAVAARFDDMDLPAAALAPYLRQVTENFIVARGSAMTGPLSRGDGETVESNLGGLAGDELQGLYRAYLKFHAEARP
jgi:2-dehydropantoate 2-reductase